MTGDECAWLGAGLAVGGGVLLALCGVAGWATVRRAKREAAALIEHAEERAARATMQAARIEGVIGRMLARRRTMLPPP